MAVLHSLLLLFGFLWPAPVDAALLILSGVANAAGQFLWTKGAAARALVRGVAVLLSHAGLGFGDRVSGVGRCADARPSRLAPASWWVAGCFCCGTKPSVVRRPKRPTPKPRCSSSLMLRIGPRCRWARSSISPPTNARYNGPRPWGGLLGFDRSRLAKRCGHPQRTAAEAERLSRALKNGMKQPQAPPDGRSSKWLLRASSVR